MTHPVSFLSRRANTTTALVPSTDGGITHAVAITISPRLAAVTIQADFQGATVTPRAASPGPYTAVYTCTSPEALGCAAGHVFVAAGSSPAINASAYHVDTDRGSARYHWLVASSPQGWMLPSGVSTDAEVLLPGALLPGVYAFTCNVTDDATTQWVTVVVEALGLSLNVTNGTTVHAGADINAAWGGYLPAGTFLQFALRSASVSPSTSPTVLPPVDAAASKAALTVPATLPVGPYTLAAVPVDGAVLGGLQGSASTLSTSVLVHVVSAFEPNLGAWSACSASCGKGLQSRSVACSFVAVSPALPASTESCWPGGVGMPAATQSCIAPTACATPQWHVGDWGACSKSCDYGQRTRTVECVSGDGETVVVDATCLGVTALGAKPATSEACAAFPCPTYSWVTKEWGVCKAKCGAGTQYRAVQCVNDATRAVVAASNCAAGSKPAASRDCDAGSCNEPFYSVGSWSKCPVDCGGGTTTRTVTCHLNSTTLGASLAECAPLVPEPAPAASRVCNSLPCFNLRVGDLSACSATCGGGVRTRAVSCRHYTGATASLADCSSSGLKVPAVSETCNAHACVPPSFCSTTDCSGRGTCDEAAQACVCDTGRSGDHCEVSADCAGVQLADGACCATPGTVMANGLCCPSGVVSKHGACCAGGASARLTPCGLCTTTSAAVQAIDMASTCCAVDSLAGNGLCCDGTVDACGVCDGLNHCPVSQQASVSAAYATLEALFGSGAVSTFNARVKELLGITHGATSVVTEWALGSARLRRRLVRVLVGGALLGCFCVSPSMVVRLLVMCCRPRSLRPRPSRLAPSRWTAMWHHSWMPPWVVSLPLASRLRLCSQRQSRPCAATLSARLASCAALQMTTVASATAQHVEWSAPRLPAQATRAQAMAPATT